MNKLNFGCGSVQPEGWMNLDFDEEFNAPYKDINEIEDNSLDMIVAHCTLQITPYHEMDNLLATLRRKLKLGCALRISLPDIVRGFEAYQQGDTDWFPNGEPNIDERLSAWLTWYSTTKTLLTSPALMIKLREVGFNSFARTNFKQTTSGMPEITELDTRNNECYFVEGIK